MTRPKLPLLALLVVLAGCGAAPAEDKVLYEKQSPYNFIVVTEDAGLVSGLVVTDKAARVHNYHTDTVHSFQELVAAAGLDVGSSSPDAGAVQGLPTRSLTVTDWDAGQPDTSSQWVPV